MVIFLDKIISLKVRMLMHCLAYVKCSVWHLLLWYQDNLRRQYKKTEIDKIEMEQGVNVILPYILAGCKTFSPWIGILANNTYQRQFLFHFVVGFIVQRRKTATISCKNGNKRRDISFSIKWIKVKLPELKYWQANLSKPLTTEQ